MLDGTGQRWMNRKRRKRRKCAWGRREGVKTGWSLLGVAVDALPVRRRRSLVSLY